MPRPRTRFDWILAGLLLVALAARLAYVVVRVRTDPSFDLLTLDSEYYVEWARAIARGDGPAGAFYLAPLYPYTLWLFFAAFGENLPLLYALQQALVVGAAGLVALTGRRLVGETEGLFAAVLLLLYHPLVYFAARAIGEPLAIALLALSLWLVARPSPRGAAAAGVVAGIAALGRPNLLLVPLGWAALEAWRRRPARAALLVLGAALAIAPVAIRNAVVSGHVVLISSNGGMTLYTANAPDADVRGTQRPPGSVGGVATIQDEATRMARLLSGREMDAVEADRWWGRRAVDARLDDPLGTAVLLVKRAARLVSNAEISLAAAPAMDANPLRWIAPYPVCLIVGLAVGGVVALGWRRTGGGDVWIAILACTAMPLVFYVSSRYRLPVVALLCLPAGAGLAAVARSVEGVAPARRWLAVVAGAIATVGSLASPIGDASTGADNALLQHVFGLRARGDDGAAETELRRALDERPGSVRAWVALGDLLHDETRYDEAEAAFRRALEIRPGQPDASGQLGALLLEIGRPAEAVPLLERFLSVYPMHSVAWNSLVLALLKEGDVDKAHRAAALARERGAVLEPVVERLLDAS